MKLGQILVKKHLITSNVLAEVVQTQRQWSRPLGEILIGQGLIDEEQLMIALQEQHWRKQGFWVID